MKRYVLLAVLAAACASNEGATDDVKTIVVTDYNTFGITKMTARHYATTDSNLFELHAYTQENAEVALVRLRVGPMTGLVTGQTVEGAETIVKVRDIQMTQKSEEHTTIVIDADRAPDPGIKVFLLSSFVKSALKQEADIIVQGTAQETTNTAFIYGACPTDWLQTSPVAKQCFAWGYDLDPEDPDMPYWNSPYQSAPTLTASQNSATAYKASDEDYSTSWTTGIAQANGQWIKIAANAATGCTYVDQVDFSATDTAHEAAAWQIYLSMDGTNWGTPVLTGTGGGGGWFTPRPAKYVKIVQTGTSATPWNILDMRIYYTEACTELPRTDPNNGISWITTGYDSLGNLKTGGYQGSNATDGTTTTRFATQESQKPGQRLQINFGFCESVNRIVMDAGGSTWANDYARAFSVYLSMDGVNWGSPVYSGTGTSAVIDTGLFTRTNGKYMKIVQTSTTASYWWGVAELHVYGNPCYDNPGLFVPPSTEFVRATDGALTTRDRNYGGQACLGVYDQPCAGAACYFGPNGFSKPRFVNAELDSTLYPRAYWRVDEAVGSKVYDSSDDWHTPPGQNQTPLTLNNGATFNLAGHLTSALSFDGIDDNASNTAPPWYMKPTAAYAISAWVKLTTTDTYGADIVSMGDNYGLRVYNDGNVKSWFWNTSTTYKMCTTAGVNVKDGLWHHLVGTYNGANIQVWVDGVLKQTLAATGAIQYPRGTGLFVGQHGFGGTDHNMNGLIDEIRVYDHALTSADVAVLFGTSKYYWFINQVGYAALQSTPPTPYWSDLTGTQVKGCGCCGNGTGPCCGTACDNCNAVPSGSNGGGRQNWDY